MARVLQSQSGGLFELYDLSLGAATIDYHVHHKMDETLCVVEGQIEFNVQGKKFLRPAGSVAFVPRGLHHGFTNLGPARARVLITFTPPTGSTSIFASWKNCSPAATRTLSPWPRSRRSTTRSWFQLEMPSRLSLPNRAGSLPIRCNETGISDTSFHDPPKERGQEHCFLGKGNRRKCLLLKE